MAKVRRSCNGCARQISQYCLVCKDHDLYISEREQAEAEMLCDIMCDVPDDEDDDEDCEDEWNKYYYDTRL